MSAPASLTAGALWFFLTGPALNMLCFLLGTVLATAGGLCAEPSKFPVPAELCAPGAWPGTIRSSSEPS